MQVLYRWCLTKENTDEIISNFQDDKDFIQQDHKHFYTLLEHVLENQEQVDQLVTSCSERSLIRIGPIEQVLIRSAISEMQCYVDTDKTIIIAEAVRLAKKYGEEESHRFVNGVLDQVKDKL